jgi:hypothetical protein
MRDLGLYLAMLAVAFGLIGAEVAAFNTLDAPIYELAEE